MTVTYKIWSFPTFPISGQIFSVPGISAEGGFTLGGARISSPEPGGFGVVEIQPALQTGEWDYPLASWLMSKVNGEILRFRLAPTPQISSARAIRATQPWNAEGIYSISSWEGLVNWTGDFIAVYSSASLVGSNTLVVDLDGIGPVLQPGHVIGHAYDCYKIEEIAYVGTIATIRVKPPLRRAVAVNDTVLFIPYFTGQISNGGEIIKMYEAEMNGHIEMPKIILSEVVLP